MVPAPDFKSPCHCALAVRFIVGPPEARRLDAPGLPKVAASPPSWSHEVSSVTFAPSGFDSLMDASSPRLRGSSDCNFIPPQLPDRSKMKSDAHWQYDLRRTMLESPRRARPGLRWPLLHRRGLDRNLLPPLLPVAPRAARSEEHTSELQSLRHLVCRLLLE